MSQDDFDEFGWNGDWDDDLSALDKQHESLDTGCKKSEETNKPEEPPGPPREDQHVFKYRRIPRTTSITTQCWSHDLYRGPGGVPIIVNYSKTLSDSEELAKSFQNELILGFDMEWKPYTCWNVQCRKRNCHDLQQRISVIQIAAEDRIGIFHIGLHKGSEVEAVLAPTLRGIIESRDVIKAGVAINNVDGHRLRKFFRLNPQALMELSDIHHAAKKKPTDYAGLVSLAGLVKQHLGLPLPKPHNVRASNWSRALSAEQISYAASDAYAGLVLFHVLENKRKGLDPAPARPEFAEISKTSRRKRAAASGSSKSGTTTGVPAVNKLRQAEHVATREDLYNLRETIRQNILELSPIEPHQIAHDSTLDLLASNKPANTETLSTIPGGTRFLSCAKQCDIDLIQFLQRPRSPNSMSEKESMNSPPDDTTLPSNKRKGRSTKRKAVALHSHSSSSEAAFGEAPVRRGQPLGDPNSVRGGRQIQHVDLTGEPNTCIM